MNIAQYALIVTQRTFLNCQNWMNSDYPVDADTERLPYEPRLKFQLYVKQVLGLCIITT